MVFSRSYTPYTLTAGQYLIRIHILELPPPFRLCHRNRADQTLGPDRSASREPAQNRKGNSSLYRGGSHAQRPQAPRGYSQGIGYFEVPDFGAECTGPIIL